RSRPYGLRRGPQGLPEDPGRVGGRLRSRAGSSSCPSAVQWGRRFRGPDRGGTTMSAKAKLAKTNTVVLLKHRVGRQGVELPAGATLGDLLREANVDQGNQTISIDGKAVEDFVVLRPGMVVSAVPRPGNPPWVGSWRAGLGMLKDDPVFLEVCEAVEKRR